LKNPNNPDLALYGHPHAYDDPIKTSTSTHDRVVDTGLDPADAASLGMES
jgi:hypothetical protein